MSEPIQANGETILVVDDDELLRGSIVRTLRRCGYSTVAAASAEQALALLETRTVDAMVLDIRMPGTDGHAMLQQLRDRDLWVPVVMASGAASVDDAVIAFRSGKVVDFLTKPFPAAELAAAVSRALHGDDTPASRQPSRAITAAAAAAGAVSGGTASAAKPGRSFTSPGDRSEGRSLMSEVRKRLAAGRIAMPMPPAVIDLLSAALRDPDVEDQAIADAIRTDASLVVQVVRSAAELHTRRAPGKGRDPDGLLPAVQRLGPRRLLAITVAHSKRRAHRAFELQELQTLSQRVARRTERCAAAVAILSEIAGRECPVEDRAEVQVAELGEPLLLHAVERALLDGIRRPTAQEIRRELARHHAAFGAAVADQWGLGDRLRTLIRRHHEPNPVEALSRRPELRDRVFLHALGRAAVRRTMAAPALDTGGPRTEECLAVIGLSRGGFDAAVERLKSHLKGGRLAA